MCTSLMHYGTRKGICYLGKNISERKKNVWKLVRLHRQAAACTCHGANQRVAVGLAGRLASRPDQNRRISRYVIHHHHTKHAGYHQPASSTLLLGVTVPIELFEITVYPIFAASTSHASSESGPKATKAETLAYWQSPPPLRCLKVADSTLCPSDLPLSGIRHMSR